ncbi:MAG TPA: tRNA guanosine(34) transglycosylase Tgt [Polyangia bacterium]|nr:tRNA guanosine(34) transglycosylase Tgt [Polyangia bacterium]
MSVFRVEARAGRARAGVLETAHGPVETPVFMPVGTQATVKALSSDDVRRLGPQIVLGNTYHLALRPGAERIAALGGLHEFMNWGGAILTDSGGFQVFSLRERCKIDEDGVTFRSHLDGSEQRLTPERAMQIQRLLGSDVAMVFDHCPPSNAPRADIEDAMARTTAWARRSLAAPAAPGQLRFGIVQGGTHLDLRRRHLGELVEMTASGRRFDGLALGGLGVGEAPEIMYEVIGAVAPEMPEDRPRYLMGVGTPKDIWTGIRAGIDMFDCVMPTRNARNGQLFVRAGKLNISNAQYRDDPRPVEDGCPCECCSQYSRAYLAHLFHAEELLYYRLASVHNLQHYLDLARRAREVIRAGAIPAEPW